MNHLRTQAAVLLLLFSATLLSAADLSIPELNLLSTGEWDNDASTVTLQTQGDATLDISGGYKFGGSLSLGFSTDNLSYSGQDASDNAADTASLAAYIDNQTYLQFQGAEVSYRELFGMESSSISWFIGETDTFCSGDIFPEHFASGEVSTRYQGQRYFQSNFDGIHSVNGTGMALRSGFGSQFNRSAIYLYQDGYLGEGVFSVDAYSAFSFDTIKLEAFAGSTFPKASAGLYRAGLFFHYAPGNRGEFLAEIGVPRWAAPEPFAIGDFYFLFEPRVKIAPLTVILTLFWQPNYYLQSETVEGESADIHINFLFGDSPESTLSGGLESSFIINTDYAETGDDQFEIVGTPYLSLSTPGVSWDFALDVQLLPFNLSSLVQGVISIKAVL